MAKSKRHTLLVTLWFDKPVTRAQAVKEYRDSTDGEWCAGGFSEAEVVKVTSARNVSTKKGG